MTCTKNAPMPFLYFFGEIATFGAVVKKKHSKNRQNHAIKQHIDTKYKKIAKKITKILEY